MDVCEHMTSDWLNDSSVL